MSETTSNSGASKQRPDEKAAEAPKAKSEKTSKSTGSTAKGTGPKDSSAKSTGAKKATTAKSGSKSQASKSSASGSSSTKSSKSSASKSKSSAQSTGTKKVAESTADGKPATAVDVPLGVLLGAVDRVGGFVGPLSSRDSAEKRVREYRTNLEESVRRASERGAGARGQAQDRLRRLQDADRLKVLADRAENLQREFERTLDSQSTRAQELIGQVGSRIGVKR